MNGAEQRREALLRALRHAVANGAADRATLNLLQRVSTATPSQLGFGKLDAPQKGRMMLRGRRLG